MRSSVSLRLLLMACALVFAGACATPPTHRAPPRRGEHGITPARESTAPVRSRVPTTRVGVAATALEMVGSPYEWGGSSPRGFDCSGLVLYSYRAAGITGLPHSARRLEEIAAPLRLSQVEPGDLLFFRLTGKKTAHVGIYVGRRHFVHAPSRGRRVEKVSFDHVYWGRQLQTASAGRIQR